LTLVRHCRTVSVVQIVASTTYERAVRKLLSPAEREAMERSIAADPRSAPVIPGTGGIRKLRWSGSGRGKRGGVRTIYFFHGEIATIYLLTIYAKGDRKTCDQRTSRLGRGSWQPSRERPANDCRPD
jgi:mRNA-degrading endonuclease RelE of RelBE toxin-antitoxin system